MDQAIETAYQTLVDERSAESDDYRDIVRTVEVAEKQLGMKFRADATYFIASSLVDSVMKPLSTARAQGNALLSGIASDTVIRDFVQNDVLTIASSSADAAKEREKDYVSATSVIAALSDVYPGLKLADAKLWGQLDES